MNIVPPSKVLFSRVLRRSSDTPEDRHKVWHSVRRNKREVANALVTEAKHVANPNDFRNVYRITKEPACGRKSFDGLVKDVNDRILIHDDEELMRWKEHFTMVLTRMIFSEVSPRMIFSEVSPLVDEMASHLNMRIWTVPPGRREIIAAITALSKATSLHRLLAAVFIAAPTVIADLVILTEIRGIRDLSQRMEEGGDYR